jgi:hypothetical protein
VEGYCVVVEAIHWSLPSKKKVKKMDDKKDKECNCNTDVYYSYKREFYSDGEVKAEITYMRCKKCHKILDYMPQYSD